MIVAFNTIYVLHSADYPLKQCGLLSIVVPDLWPLNSVRIFFFSLFFFLYFQCVYCMCVLHNILQETLTQNVKFLRAFPLNWIDVVRSVFHLQAFPSARALSDILWWRDVKPALGFNPAGSWAESRSTGGISDNWRLKTWSNCILLWIL